MADQQPSFWSKALFGALGLLQKAEKQAAAAKDGRLRKYDARLTWTDPKVTTHTGEATSVRIEATVYAESDRHAREVAQAYAIKEKPIIESAFSDRKVAPPYMTDPDGTLAKWTVGEMPLDADERERAASGQLGPPRAIGFAAVHELG